MTIATSETFAACADGLRDGQDPRVWSVIVTVFGDLAQAPGDQVSGALLSRIAELMGLRPDAVRVALHRLRKDDWIESERHGRRSLHRLTPQASRQSVSVSPRIYARHRVSPDRWVAAAADGSRASRARLGHLIDAGGWIAVSPDLALSAGGRGRHEGLLTLKADAATVPDWVKARICPDGLAAAHVRFAAALDPILDRLSPGHAMPPLEVAALRTMLVHTWRRLVLKSPDLPPFFFPDDWAEPRCRDLVWQILETLPRPALPDLELALRL